jgi:hypothetical protein
LDDLAVASTLAFDLVALGLSRVWIEADPESSSG